VPISTANFLFDVFAKVRCTQLKVPRPVSKKQKPGAVEEFKKNYQF
jgi:hypothetical protein